MKRNPYNFPFVVIEGIDGCGKSTLIEKLRQWDERYHIGSIFTREPTHGKYGEKIRRILQNKGMDENGLFVDSCSLQELYFYDRLEHRRIEAVFLERYPVISDRDFESSIAYGISEGVKPEWLFNRQEEIVSNNLFVSDLTIVLDVSAETALERQLKAGKKLDYFEAELEKKKRIREAYLNLPRILTNFYNSSFQHNIQFIDASKMPDEIADAAISLIQPIFEQKIGVL